MKCMIVIPARLASTRLSEKLLLRAEGKSILQHTYEAALKSTLADDVLVAVDDPRLAHEVDSFGGQARLTSVDCQSGTDRIAEVALLHDDVDIFLNLQGDEPEISPSTLDAVVGLLASQPEADMATAITPIRDLQQLQDPACVKVVVGQGRAITFSRAAVPHARDGDAEVWLMSEPSVYFQHLGVYAYRRSFLEWFCTQPPSILEQIEKLEQLRAIEAGKTVVVAEVAEATPGIDTLEDYRAFQERLAGASQRDV
ncbi:MAG: 3-deoxy-manno-octulosonate cytidylyltransferase [Planctomycetota bacterium]